MTLLTEQELKAGAFFYANLEKENASLAFALWGGYLTVDRLRGIGSVDVYSVTSWVKRCNEEIGEKK